jgi:mono/diheme cytochrome c family protein
VRANLAAWDRLFFKPGESQPDPSKSAEWNRGAFLTEGLGHCGLCHTPKNELGGDEQDRAMQGYALQGWFAADLTNDPHRGLGSWSVDDIATYLKTGHNKFASATGLMAEEINDSTSKLTDADLRAIAVYLKDRPGDPANAAQNRAASDPPAPETSTMKIGQQIYADECAGCHKADGKGASGLFPALAGASIVQQSDPASLLHVVLRGAAGLGTPKAPTAAGMPAFAWVLNDNQAAAVLTYIRNSWGNRAPAVTASDANKARATLVERND